MSIESLKKKFWEDYTQLFNSNSEAFELIRQIGTLQGKAIRSKEANDIIDEWFRMHDDNDKNDDDKFDDGWFLCKEEDKEDLKKLIKEKK